MANKAEMNIWRATHPIQAKCTRAVSVLAWVLLLSCVPAVANQSARQVELAASGRFDQLEQQLEAQAALGPLDTRDRHALCWAYSKTKRYGKLMACLDQLAMSLKKGNRRTRLFALDDATPSLGLMRAEALVELGQYQAATEEAERNMAWLEKDSSDDLDMVFNTLSIQSIAHTLSGNRAKGIQYAQQLAKSEASLLGSYASAKALALARARMALGDFQGVVDALNADKTFGINVFLDRLLSGGFFTGVSNWVWVELPRAYMLNKAMLEIGRLGEAKAGFDKLFAIQSAKENGEIYWQLLYDRGRIAEMENDRIAAMGYYRQAVDIVEEQRASINTEASKIGFVGDKQALYSKVIANAVASNQSALAYDYVERAKSRALVDLLAGKALELPLTPSTQAAQAAFDSYQQASDSALTQLPLDMAGADKTDSRNVLKARALDLKQKDPDLASLVTVGWSSLTEVRGFLLPDEVLLEYYLNGQNLIVMAISNDSIFSAIYEAGTLVQDVRAFRALVEAKKPGTVAAAQALHSKLIKPVLGQIKGRNLVVVPHGILHYLPFSALHDGKNYTIDGHELRYLPSASVQKYLRLRRAVSPENILILGNPDLGQADLDLPSAEEEAKAIAAMVPQSKILTRKEASETVFKKIAVNHPYLHIAAHGEFNSDAPLQSHMILAADKSNDGSLTVSEIFGLRLNAELVTLSSCETGLSKSMSGDDLIGMTRGFLYAGSSNIVASLWEVDDAATSELMKQFYRNIMAGQTKKAALRGAQRALQSRFPDPLYWAGFYLIGQGQ